MFLSKCLMLILLLFHVSGPASATLDFYALYPRPTNAEIYQRADIIAIVKTLSGTITPTGEKGRDESKVVSEVVTAIKGTEPGAELEIYNGAAEINAEHMAILRWDENVQGYRYLSHDMDYTLAKIQAYATPVPIKEHDSAERIAAIKSMNEVILSGVEERKEMLGVRGEVTLLDDLIYYPNCRTVVEDGYHRQFEQIQFMLKKLQQSK